MLHPRVAGMIQNMKISQCNPPYEQTDIKQNIIITLDAEKVFYKIQHAFMVKVLERSRQQGMCLNVIKAIYFKLKVNIKLNEIKLKAILLKSGTR